MKKVINGTFIGSIVAFLFLGLVNTLFFPDETNYYENRYAYKVEKFSVNGYLNGTFQNQMSNALNDQVPLSATMKKTYNFMNSFYENQALSLILDGVENQYVSFKGGLMFDDCIVYATREREELEPQYAKMVESIQNQAQRHPNVQFSVYYIEKDTDINFETNKKNEMYEYLENEFAGTETLFAGFQIYNFEEYSKYFYKTDHHWNCYGSYKAYKEIMQMLVPDATPVQVEDEQLLDYKFSGSKGAAIGANQIVTEKFPIYEYAYPQMEIAIDSQQVEDYGKQDKYLKEKQADISYGMVYGYDNGEIIFDMNNPEKENILIMGDSYDNAMLKLIASHFGKTHSIDLRNYETTFGEAFSFSNYIEENDIDKVLIIGGIDYFTKEVFLLED